MIKLLPQYFAKNQYWLYTLILILTLVVALLYGEQEKFPHTGVWEGQLIRQSDQGIEIWFLEFEKGGCNVGIKYLSQQVEFPCAYRMEGKSAILSFHMSNLQINEKVVNSSIIAKVVPQSNGNALRLETISIEYDDEVIEGPPAGRDVLVLHKTSP